MRCRRRDGLVESSLWHADGRTAWAGEQDHRGDLASHDAVQERVPGLRRTALVFGLQEQDSCQHVESIVAGKEPLQDGDVRWKCLEPGFLLADRCLDGIRVRWTLLNPDAVAAAAQARYLLGRLWWLSDSSAIARRRSPFASAHRCLRISR